MVKENYLLKLSLFEQETNKLQESIQAVNQQILEFESLKLSINKINGKEKDILANLGKGVFIKSEIKDKNLFVNVGSGIVLRKSPLETAEIIDMQVEELKKLKQSFVQNIVEIDSQVQELISQAQEEI